MICVEQAKKIYSICIEKASTGSTLTYKDVLSFLGYGGSVSGQVIRYGLELTWIACSYSKLPNVTAIVVNKSSGLPSASSYPINKWSEDVQEIFAYEVWPTVNDIDWQYVWDYRGWLSDNFGTPGYWGGSSSKPSDGYISTKFEYGEIIGIRSTDYWVKVVGMLQHNWALVESDIIKDECVIYFIHDGSGVFDNIHCISRQGAERALTQNGFFRFSDDENAKEFLCPPKPPYTTCTHPNGAIYSSGKYWK